MFILPWSDQLTTRRNFELKTIHLFGNITPKLASFDFGVTPSLKRFSLWAENRTKSIYESFAAHRWNPKSLKKTLHAYKSTSLFQFKIFFHFGVMWCKIISSAPIRNDYFNSSAFFLLYFRRLPKLNTTRLITASGELLKEKLIIFAKVLIRRRFISQFLKFDLSPWRLGKRKDIRWKSQRGSDKPWSIAAGCLRTRRFNDI